MTDGKEPQATPPAARFGLALEADGLLVLHRAWNQERVLLLDENAERIRGENDKEAVQRALALQWDRSLSTARAAV